jgi:hypothetical protein
MGISYSKRRLEVVSDLSLIFTNTLFRGGREVDISEPNIHFYIEGLAERRALS